MKRSERGTTCFEEVVMIDDNDMLECIYPFYGHLHRREKRGPGQFGMIHIAAGSPNGNDCLKYLIEKGESVNALCNEHDRATPLQFAVVAQNLENAHILLKNGANPNARDIVGNNAIIFATMFDNLELVKLLDQFGADATVQNDNGVCAIELAQRENKKEILLHFMSQ